MKWKIQNIRSKSNWEPVSIGRNKWGVRALRQGRELGHSSKENGDFFKIYKKKNINESQKLWITIKNRSMNYRTERQKQG